MHCGQCRPKPTTPRSRLSPILPGRRPQMLKSAWVNSRSCRATILAIESDITIVFKLKAVIIITSIILSFTGKVAIIVVLIANISRLANAGSGSGRDYKRRAWHPHTTSPTKNVSEPRGRVVRRRQSLLTAFRCDTTLAMGL